MSTRRSDTSKTVDGGTMTPDPAIPAAALVQRLEGARLDAHLGARSQFHARLRRISEVQGDVSNAGRPR
jgi:hypothetical protein